MYIQTIFIVTKIFDEHKCGVEEEVRLYLIRVCVSGLVKDGEVEHVRVLLI